MKKKLLSAFAIIASSYLCNAQVSLYAFSQSAGTYNAITGGSVIATATGTNAAGTLDDAIYNLPAASFPFTFTFNGIGYTGCNISSNGFITFGATAPGVGNYLPISGAGLFAGSIAAWGGDLNSMFSAGTFSLTGQIRFEIVGIAPNREVVIQYSNWRPSYTTSTTNVFGLNFQIRLEETTNKVSVVYGSNGYVVGSTVITGTRQIGLRGATNADYNDRLNTAAVSFTASTAGTANTSTQTYSTTGTVPGMPTNGLTYSWAPPLPCSGTPNAGNATASSTILCAASNVTLNLAGSTTGVTGLTYQWLSSPDGTMWNAISTATNISTTQSVTATTYYQCAVACGTNVANSTTITVTLGATPNAGITAATSTLVCPNQAINLSLTGASSMPGLIYQWQSSATGASYTPIVPTASLATTTQTISSDIYFQNVLTCGSATAASTPIQILVAGTTTNTIPYFEGFEGITVNNQLPNCSWMATSPGVICLTYTSTPPPTVYNRIPKSGTKFGSFRWGTAAAGDYFYTNGIQLTGGVNYQASADYIADGLTGWSEFSLLVGSSQSTVGLTNIISVTGAITNTVYANTSGTFSVPTTGIYYIAVKAIGNSTPWYLTFDDLNVIAAPTCTQAPVAGIINGPTSVNSGSNNLFSMTGATGNFQWYSGSSAIGPWTPIAGATSVNQTITAVGTGTVYYTAVLSNPGCVNDTADVPHQVVINFPGDNVCDAIPLTIGSSTVQYGLLGATTQTGEVAPAGSGCSTNNSWCNNILNNSRWFSFVAPASGYVTVQSPDFDTQLAVWKTASCTDLLSASTATLIAANDDDLDYTLHGGVNFSSFLRAACLTPGVTYYIQLDSYSAATSTDITKVLVMDMGIALDTSFTGLASNYCLPGASSSSLTPAVTGGIFTVNSNTSSVTSFSPSTIGTNTVMYSIYGCKTNSTTVVANTPTVMAMSSNTVVCAGSTATLSAMGATNYTWSSGGITSTEIVNPTVPTTYTLTGEDSGCFNTSTVSVGVNSLPVVSATASNTLVCINLGESSILTASTSATSYTWSDGANTMTTTVTPTVGTTYTLTVNDGTCDASTTVFVDAQFCMGVTTIAASANGINVYPNPTNGILNISISSELSGNTSIEVYDAIGKLTIKENLTGNTTAINISKLDDGIYVFKIINNNKAVNIGKIVKQ